jgi:hypothetical protein
MPKGVEIFKLHFLCQRQYHFRETTAQCFCRCILDRVSLRCLPFWREASMRDLAKRQALLAFSDDNQRSASAKCLGNSLLKHRFLRNSACGSW